MKVRRSLFTNPAAAAIGGAAVATLAVGGVTAVEAATTPKPVKACADSKQALRLSVKGKCPKGTHAVTLSARGPQGPVGPSGAPGSTGATGATGPSTTYLARAPIAGVFLPGETGNADANKIKPVASVTVDPGSYVVGLTVTARHGNGTTINEHVSCTVVQLAAGGGAGVLPSSLSPQYPTTYFLGGFGHIDYGFTAILSARTTLQLECQAFGNDAPSTQDYTSVLNAELRTTLVGQVVDQSTG